MFFKLSLLLNYLKEHETNIQTFPAIVTNISEFFVESCREIMNDIYATSGLLQIFEHKNLLYCI